MRLKLASLALALAAAQASAQGFPSKAVRFIVTGPPGAPTDTLPRGLTDLLGKAIGQTVVVENRIGADGIIGADACAKSPPDGHTVCSFSNTVMAMNPALHSKLPYDPVKDFAGVVFSGFFDSLLLVHSSVPANSVKELLELGRSKPNALVWGHFGLGTTGNLYREWFGKSREVRFYPVPYKTTTQVLQAIVAGEAQVAVYAWPNVMPAISAGKLKALATTSDKRLPFMPSVPTFEEEGIKLPLRGWFGYNVPAATPRPVVQRLNTEIRRIMKDPFYREKILDAQGVLVSDGSPEEYDALVRDQVRLVADLVKYLGVKPE
jgi:tripartite-type tricarboxylate transporter receptor subunit TctC